MKSNILNEKQMSVNFGFYAENGWYSSDKAYAEVDAIAAAGINWVVLVATVFQETYSSTVQFRDFDLTPSDDELIDIIKYLHSKGIRVQLRPMLETLDGKGRLAIWFPDDGERVPGKATTFWQDWFKSMEKRAVHYAKIAEKTGCEIYCLDSELDRTIMQNEGWKRVVKAVREVYSGPITSCHTSHTGITDFKSAFSNKNHWFYDLDFLSISCYHPAANEGGATVSEMIENYKSQLNRFREFADSYKKPIFFGECGCASRIGAATWPSGFSAGSYSGEEQANYLTAVVETFKNEPWWLGLAWWKWEEHIDRPYLKSDPKGDTGFTIKGKPTEKLFTKYTKEFSE